MIVFPNCKINLGLNILRKRSDGYHDLETIFYPIPLTDSLEIIENKDPGKSPTFPFTSSGLSIAGKPSSNLCVKAYRMLKQDFPGMHSVKIHLHKVIPSGAGLGGGSADAAFSLKVMNEIYKLQLTTEQLIDYAAELGSDCPFFIINKPCFATGRGEILEEINVDLSVYKIILVNPGIHVNTGWAFSKLTPALPLKSVKEIVQQPVETWKAELKNDFEEPVFIAHPRVKEIKESLYNQGAVYAAMSGSGSTVFGIFEQDAKPELLKERNYFIKTIN